MNEKMSKHDVEFVKERIYNMREIRRLRKLTAIKHLKQGRIDFLLRRNEFMCMCTDWRHL